MLNQFITIRKITGIQKLKLICDGPPQGKPDLPIKFSDACILKCREGFSNECTNNLVKFACKREMSHE